MAVTIESVREERPPGRTMLLTEAASWYDVSQATLYRLLSAGRLRRYKRSGDRRTYLSVEELERELRPEPEETETPGS